MLGLIIVRGDEVIDLTIEGPPPADESRLAKPAAAGPGGPGLGRAAGRGMPVGPAITAAPAGLAGPAAGFGGPAPGAMMPRPQMHGAPGMRPPMAGPPPGMPPPGYRPGMPPPGMPPPGMPPPGYRPGMPPPGVAPPGYRPPLPERPLRRPSEQPSGPDLRPLSACFWRDASERPVPGQLSHHLTLVRPRAASSSSISTGTPSSFLSRDSLRSTSSL